MSVSLLHQPPVPTGLGRGLYFTAQHPDTPVAPGRVEHVDKLAADISSQRSPTRPGSTATSSERSAPCAIWNKKNGYSDPKCHLDVRHADVWDAVEILRDVLATGAWKRAEFQIRAEVT